MTKPARIVLCIFFLTTVISLKGQTNFIKGYYITHTHDTIRGFIEYRRDERNKRTCAFKQYPDTEPIRFSPAAILGYNIDGRIDYEAHSVSDAKGETLKGFFKVIFRGKISLLAYGRRYFVKEPDGEMTEITSGVKTVDGRKVADRSGMGELKALMQECGQIDAFLKEEYGRRPDFEELFRKYYACAGEPFVAAKEVTIKPVTEVGVLASPAFARLSFKLSGTRRALNGDVLFTGGVFASRFIPRVDENLRINFEATYTRYTDYGFFSADGNNNDLFADVSYVRTPIVVSYSKGKAIFEFGFLGQVILKQDNTWRLESLEHSDVFTRSENLSNIRRLSTGTVIGVGLKRHLGGWVIQPSIRYSQLIQGGQHPSRPFFQSVALSVGIGPRG